MSGARIKTIACGLLVTMAFTLSASAQTARVKLIGAWHLVRIDAPGPDGKPASGQQPRGMLVYTRDGHMSVQLMYRPSADTLFERVRPKGI